MGKRGKEAKRPSSDRKGDRRRSRTGLGVAIWIVLAGALAGIVALAAMRQGPSAPEAATAPDPERVARGRAIFEANCAACHGANGVGEDPANLEAAGGYPAPPLDASGHAWHHTDRDLAAFISNGSPNTPRMRAWKTTLTQQQIGDVVQYIKSLWGPRERSCQGPRHMDPACR